MISPKKKDHRGMGSLAMRYCMSLAREKKLMAMPSIREKRNVPLICFQNVRIFPVNSSLNACVLIDLIELSSSS